jgi:hypothetical protein
MALTDNLISYWKLNESNSATTVTDYYGSNHGVATNPNFSSGKFGNAAYSPDGTGRIQLTNDILTTNNHTMMCWYKTVDASKTTTFFGQTFNMRPIGEEWGGIGLSYSSYASQGFSYGLTRNAGSSQQQHMILISSYVATNDVWYHIACTYNNLDANRMKIYINGNLIVQNYSWDIDINTRGKTQPNILASYSGTTLSTSTYGYVDDLIYWNRALTITEIQEIYNAGVSFGQINWPLSISNTSLASQVQGTSTNIQLSPTYGSEPYTWSIV